MYYERVLYMHVNVFYSNEAISNLVMELPNYLAAATDVAILWEEDKVNNPPVFYIYEGAAGAALVYNRWTSILYS